MAKEQIWQTKIDEYREDFYLYLSCDVSEDYSPQEIKKDLEDFRQWMIEKHVKKSNNKNRFSDWWKNLNK